MTHLRIAAACAAAVLSLVSLPSHAFSDDEARQAILKLRRQVEVLQDAQAAQLQLAGQIEQLLQQNRQLTGQIEELRNGLQRESRAVRELADQLALVMPQQIEADGQTFSVPPEARRAWEEAEAKFSRGEFDSAERAYRDFASQWAATGLRPSALYRMASAQFAAGRSADSVRTQNLLLKEYPDYSRAPEAMLSKSAGLAAQGRTKDAAWVLRQLLKNYPDSEAAKEVPARLKVLQGK